MADLINQKVFIEVQERSYGTYGNYDREWVEGVIFGVFSGGDVLVHYNYKYYQRCSTEDVAFQSQDTLTDLKPSNQEAKVRPSKSPSQGDTT